MSYEHILTFFIFLFFFFFLNNIIRKLKIKNVVNEIFF